MDAVLEFPAPVIQPAAPVGAWQVVLRGSQGVGARAVLACCDVITEYAMHQYTLVCARHVTPAHMHCQHTFCRHEILLPGLATASFTLVMGSRGCL